MIDHLKINKKNDNIKLYIKDTDNNKIKRLIIPKNKTIQYLKYKIIKKLKLKEEDIKLKYSTKVYNNNIKLKDTNIPNNATIFISTRKLKGGDIGMAYGLITVPNTALMINLIFLIIVCPIQYFFLMYGSRQKVKILKMKYSSSFFSNFNNFKIREMYDNMAKKELDKDLFPNFKYSILKSKLYAMYALLYFAFVSFFSNLLPLSTFIDHYGKIGTGNRTSKCFIHTNTSSIIMIGTLVIGVIPGIIFFLNFFGFQYGLIIYFITLAGGCACLLTSVYYKQYQNLKDAKKYRDPMVPESDYTGSNSEDFKYMPSYFWSLYITPFICVFIILFLYLLDIRHSVIWGLICSFYCVTPLFYLMGNQMSLYCIQFPFCTRSAEQLEKSIEVNNYDANTAEDNKELLIYTVQQ